jgi:hypothetical protein
MMHRVATATIRWPLDRIGEELARPAPVRQVRLVIDPDDRA